ncbi:MAG: KUP/HAK/KT family potassium transporter [Candidatus Methanoperedens sp.]|nr:KUP/HAK/KT family potassium transporter [Candidatus Methanoperedens sp.]MCE8426265.1 KUP/HAK/KT family potassium transporter [Candidatus Methanoperedens sp.]MCE8428019.1 KUP/HAK/KT family potassium transporter [Candidatus Methanoperedens sp.]
MFDKKDLKGIIKSLGLVFGDIGTSPIYTLTVIFLMTTPSRMHVMGILSLIIWTLILVVSVQYAWLAMSLGRKGEGGTIVLREILVPMLRSGRQVAFVTLLSYVGISLLFGDGVITPAISILSAVEGLLLIPGLEGTTQDTLVIIAGLIAVLLFAFQKKGTEKVSKAFGPLMVLWFFSLAVSGILSIIRVPSVILALNPYYALSYLSENGTVGFFVLSQVILCATGGEALFADMGQLGRLPILRAWYFVFFALLLNYLGQGAFLIVHPDDKNVLFEMVFEQVRIFYVPFLILSIIATVIASQAMISGMFSIVYQAINTRVLPMLKVDYTSSELRSQIYIDSVNWLLLFFVLFVMFVFKESNHLAAAYGLAVNGIMVITGIMITWIFYLRKKMRMVGISIFITIIDVVFLMSSLYKIPHGGYWSLIMASMPFCIIMIYLSGQKRLYLSLSPMDLKVFLEKYKKLSRTTNKIWGTALFFAKDVRKIPTYMVNTMFINNIVYEDNIIVSIFRTDEPFGVASLFKDRLAEGLRVFEIKLGYMEIADVEKILKESGISEKTIFYGIEDIVTENIIWKVYSVMKKLTPAFVQFYKLPPHKLHGVITRIEM